MGSALTASADDYYEFSTFSGTGYEYDIACHGNTIYYGSGTSIYSIDVSVADLTKKDEPKLLSGGTTSNPNYQIRTFSNPKHITLGSVVNSGSVGEMYVDDSYIYRTYQTQVKKFNKNTGAYVSTVVTGGGDASYANYLSYGNGKWWSGNGRSVYSSTGGEWSYEFTWANMAGSHGDGMEFVNGFVFVSDMTSNHIAQWGYGDNPDTTAVESGWTEWNRFDYTEIGGSNKALEGMGFGALGHFWAGNGSTLYELGGGKIQGIIEDNNPVPEPATMFLFGLGLLGIACVNRKKTIR